MKTVIPADFFRQRRISLRLKRESRKERLENSALKLIKQDPKAWIPAFPALDWDPVVGGGARMTKNNTLPILHLQ
ncbi:MAG: hypothetical protein A2Z83_01640 [Omnitrophica bacterium GWA2_52_8]|nr:MAG: hypothetical protein A2Z83_01640 [Omnitrophica bacterium GWA2_52_8]